MPRAYNQWSEEEIERLRELRAEGRFSAEIAQIVGRSVNSVANKIQDLGIPMGKRPVAEEPVVVSRPIDPEETAEEIIARQKKRFRRKKEAEKERSLIDVRVNIEGPIAIAHFGDPHLDDDGTDWERLEADIETVKSTEGMFAANVGDYTNNWVGRLVQQYEHQHVTRTEGHVLTEWLFKELPWLYLIGGNHDAWNGGNDVLGWLAKSVGTRYEAWGARIALRFPNGAECRINARHDFKGHSQFNPAHGPTKASKMGFADGRDHIYTCGHKHTFGYLQWAPGPGMICHCIQVNAYKQMDPYAKQLGFVEHEHAPCVVTVIDPDYADVPERFVTVFTDVQEAAEFLAFKRRRKAA